MLLEVAVPNMLSLQLLPTGACRSALFCATAACCYRSATDTDHELRCLRAEVAAKEAELRDAKHAEAEYAAECDQLSRALAAERLKAKVRQQKVG